MEYVVCLLFSDDLKQVVLIKKNRPLWQAGLLNGPGGKIEADESIDYAARREFLEETGIVVPTWKHLVVQHDLDDKYKVHYLVAKTSYEILNHIRSITDELVGCYSVEYLDSKQLVNTLAWLIPLAIYSLSGKMDNEVCIIKP